VVGSLQLRPAAKSHPEVLGVEIESTGREKVSFSETEVYNHDLCPKLALTPFRVVAILSVSVRSAEIHLGSYV